MSSATLPEDLWASQLSSVPPKELLSRLTAHSQRSNQFNETLADYFRARSAAEADYAAALNKIVRKFADSGLGRDAGGEGGLWERAMSEIVETASAQTSLSDTLAKEFESPLRSMPSRNSAWSRISSIQDKAGKTVKSYDSSLEKVQKAQKKGGSKLQMAQNDLQNTTTSLAGILPALISAHQSMTLDRLTELKELGVKFETVLAENGNRRVDGSERGMNRLLGWEVEEEVRGMAVKFGGSPNAGGGPPAGSAREMGGFGGGAVGTPTRSSTVRRPTLDSNHSSTPGRNSSSSRPTIDNGLPKPEHSSLTSTLKSKFSRKSSLLGNVGLGSGSSPNDRFAGNGGRGRAGSDATVRTNATGANAGRAGFAAVPGSYDNNDRNSYETGRSGVPIASPIAETPRVDADGFTLPPENRGQAPWERPTGTPRNLLDDEDDETDGVSPLPTPGANGSFSAPKLNMALAPLPIEEDETERQAALQKMQSTLLAKPPAGPGRKNTIRGRRDVRNTTFNALPDDMPLAQALKLQGQQEDAAEQSRMVESPVQEVLSTPPGSAFPSGKPSMSSGTFTGLNPLTTQFTGRGTNNNNVSSPSSMVGSLNPFDQNGPAIAGPGLRATMTETVNAISKGGLVQKAMVTGEICVTMRDLPQYIPSNGVGPIHIRLDEFEQLEKVAPNPKYLSQVPERPGEYYLNVELLASATISQSSRPVLFKYQLHVGDGRAGEFAPIEVHPQWKTAAGETRLLINYKSNDQGRLARSLAATSSTSPFGESTSGKLSEVSVVAGLGGPEITGVQAKPPGGTWSAEKRKMVWNVTDVDLDSRSAASAGKIVARFVSSPDAPLGQPQGVSLQWKCQGGLTSGLSLSIVTPPGTAEGWRFEEVGKAVVSGKYTAE